MPSARCGPPSTPTCGRPQRSVDPRQIACADPRGTESGIARAACRRRYARRDDDRARADLRTRRSRRGLATEPGAPRHVAARGLLRATGRPTSRRSRRAPSPTRHGSGRRPSTTSSWTGSAGRRRSSTCRGAPSGRAGGPAAPSTTRPRPSSRARPAIRAARRSTGRARTASPPADQRRARGGRRARGADVRRPQGVRAGDRVGDLPADARRDGRSRRSRWAGSRRSSRRSSRATARRRSRPGCATARRALLVTADGFLRRGSAGRR